MREKIIFHWKFYNYSAMNCKERATFYYYYKLLYNVVKQIQILFLKIG